MSSGKPARRGLNYGHAACVAWYLFRTSGPPRLGVWQLDENTSSKISPLCKDPTKIFCKPLLFRFLLPLGGRWLLTFQRNDSTYLLKCSLSRDEIRSPKTIAWEVCRLPFQDRIEKFNGTMLSYMKVQRLFRINYYRTKRSQQSPIGTEEWRTSGS